MDLYLAVYGEAAIQLTQCNSASRQWHRAHAPLYNANSPVPVSQDARGRHMARRRSALLACVDILQPASTYGSLFVACFTLIQPIKYTRSSSASSIHAISIYPAGWYVHTLYTRINFMLAWVTHRPTRARKTSRRTSL